MNDQFVDAKIDPDDQPSDETKLATLAGNKTGWSFGFNAPPVCTHLWTHRDWVTYIGNRWFRTEEMPP